MLLRASELFADDDGRVYPVNYVIGEDVVFCAGDRQVKRGDSPEVDAVEVLFRGSKGD